MAWSDDSEPESDGVHHTNILYNRVGRVHNLALHFEYHRSITNGKKRWDATLFGKSPIYMS